jgi:hypothetical protein
MNGKPNKMDSLEVSSNQLRSELIAIKERIGALETIASIANRPVVEEYVRTHLRTEKARAIMRECAEPRTREHLISKFGFNSAPALDHHLNPLRQDDLIEQHFDEDSRQTFELSRLVRRLPKRTLDTILKDPA